MSARAGRHRPPVFGREPWSTIGGASWSHWDLWYCLVAALDHDGDLSGLEAVLVAALRDPLQGRQAVEAKLSHLADLRERLASAGLAPSELVPADARADRTLVAKARRKLAELGLDGRAMTPAMVETPRVRLVRRARTGRWSAFPVDPARYYRSFRGNVEVKADYALDYQEETLPWSRVPAGQAELVERFLLSLESECRRYHLDYESEQARTQVAWLAVARRRFRRYVEVAGRLGSDHWREIEALAESALRSDRRELAVEVFRGADRPGWHRVRLRARCLELTGVDLTS